MKRLRKILDSVGLRIKEGKFSRFYHSFQALDNFIFAAAERPVHSPFGRDPLDVKRYMTLVIVAVTPAFFASLYFFGFRILLMFVVSYAAGGAAELLFSIIRKEEVNEGFLVTGFLFPLILPPALPLWLVAVGVVFGVVVGKEVFGGTGRNVFNPALVGRVFLALGYPSLMSTQWIEPGSGIWGKLTEGLNVDSVSSATPLVLAKAGEFTDNLDLFFGRVLGSAGETSALMIIVGGLFLVMVGIASWRTVLSVLVSFAGFTAILHAVMPDRVGPVLFNLLSGGILFGTFFMATDPVSGPITRQARWAYGMIIGVVAVLIRSFSGFVEGVMFAILLGNTFAPLLDEVVIRANSRRLARE
ncbi:MAG: RnfABCDGE type electron transport complex subunit D [Spirochaetia bacterium]